MLIGVLCGLSYMSCGSLAFLEMLNEETHPSIMHKVQGGYYQGKYMSHGQNIKNSLYSDIEKVGINSDNMEDLIESFFLISLRYYWWQMCVVENRDSKAITEEIDATFNNEAHKKLLICVVLMFQMYHGYEMKDIILKPLINSLTDLYFVYGDVKAIFNKILEDFVQHKSDQNSPSKALVIKILEIFSQIYTLPAGQLSRDESVMLSKIPLLRNIDSKDQAYILWGICEIIEKNSHADNLRMIEVQHQEKMALLTQKTALLKESVEVAKVLLETAPGLTPPAQSSSASALIAEPAPGLTPPAQSSSASELIAEPAPGLAPQAQSSSAPELKPPTVTGEATEPALKARALHPIIYYGLLIFLSIFVIFAIINIINIWMPMPSILGFILFT